MKKIFLCLVFALTFSFVFADGEFDSSKSVDGSISADSSRSVDGSRSIVVDEDFTPFKQLEIDENESSVFIETNIPDVDVFLNGTFYGRTNLKIDGLMSGLYRVELAKKGYMTKAFLIHVKQGYDLHYRVEMEKIVGFIDLVNVPEGARVSVTNEEKMHMVKDGFGNMRFEIGVEPGLAEVTVKAFGYETYTTFVTVLPFEHNLVKVELVPAAFELSDFSTNKASFNPEYKGSLGKCEISFKVTANGTADVLIFDAAGNEVWRKTYGSFNTWNQTCNWNGCNLNGEKLADGNYDVFVRSGSFEFSKQVCLDRTIVYPVLSANRFGLGAVGNVPVVFAEKVPFFMFFGRGGAVVCDDAVSADLGAGLLCNFGNHFEFGLQGSMFPGFSGVAETQFSLGFKIYGSTSFGSSSGSAAGKFCYGGLIRYGFSEGKWYMPSGTDCGNGIGAGLMLGLDFKKIYVGYACQYVIGSTDGAADIKDYALGNSVCLSVKPTDSVKIGLAGTYYLNNTVNADFELDFMPESSAFIINAKGGCLFDVKNITSDGLKLNFGIGLSYLF